MRPAVIRLLGIVLALGCLTWIVLAVMLIGLDIRMDDSPAKLVAMFVLVMLPPIALLGLALIVRRLLARESLSASEHARLRWLFNILGPVGALVIIFQLTKTRGRRLEVGSNDER